MTSFTPTTTPVRDLTSFRALYNLPTQSDYMAMLSSSDHAVIAAGLTAREQNAVILLRAEGFNGSTLAEAYDWWLHDGQETDGGALEDAVTCQGHGDASAGCGGSCCC